jgi:TM2 domain-containing membrane protein YozV
MKKIFSVFLVFAFLVSTTNAAVSPASMVGPEPKTHVLDMTVEQFLKLSPKEYSKLTGQKLNFIQKIKFTIGQKIAGKAITSEGKSKTVAALLAFFLGGLGIHRFYLGYTWQGVVQLLTAGGLGIWALIDFIRILTGDLTPKDGEYN